jgi:hypothetical protein
VAPFDWECIAPRQFGGGACAIDSSRDLATTRRCQIHVNGKIKKNERGFVLHRWQWKGTCKLLDSLPTRSNEPAGGASGEHHVGYFWHPVKRHLAISHFHKRKMLRKQ